jgi:prepilin-type N-terminal cleavage/methylation domain-containing protein
MISALPKLRPPALTAGFTLVELLTVLAILGILASIVLPNIAATNEAARNTVARRNAQNLASVYSCGQIAGVNWEATDVASATTTILEGKAAGDGAFAGKVFKAAGMKASDLAHAQRYLRWDSESSTLTYTQIEAP